MQPVFNFQGSAMLSVMAFAGTVLLLFGLACVTGYLWLKGRTFAARRVALAGGAIAGIYALALIGSSAAAGGRDVAAGGWKYFCELDCHLAYSIARVERPSASSAQADGGVEVVHLRVRFDRETAGPRRDDRPLTPNPRRVRLVASDGRTYRPYFGSDHHPETHRKRMARLDTPLRPGEAAVIPLAFRLPRGVTGARLLLTEASPETRFLIGHENSFFHPRAAFRLDSIIERTAAR
jgi:hypothetical protein